MIFLIKRFFNTEDKKRLLSNFFSLSVLQAFTYILPLLTLPYLVRVLGAETYGLVMFAQSFTMFFFVFVDFGFSLSATREVSIFRNDQEKLTEIFSSVMIIKALLILTSLIITSFVVFCFPKFKVDWALYFLSFLWVIGQALFPIWYFQGLEKMRYITIVNVMSKLIFTFAIFLFVKEKNDFLLVPIFNGLGFIVGGLFSLIIVASRFNQTFELQSMKTIMKYFRDSSQFFLSRISVYVYTSSNVFVLGLFTSNTMVGYYSVAEKLYQALQQFYQPITQTLYPYVAKYKNIRFFKKAFWLMVTFNLFSVLSLFFLSENLFLILFGKNIGVESLGVFNRFLVASVLVVPSVAIGYPFLGALGYAKYPNLSVIFASIFHFVGLLILAKSDNVTIYNVATLVIFTQLIDFCYRFYGVYKNSLWYKDKDDVRNFRTS